MDFGQSHAALQAPQVNIAVAAVPDRDAQLVVGIADAIGRLEEQGHFGPFAVVLDQTAVSCRSDANGGSCIAARSHPPVSGRRSAAPLVHA